MSVEIMTYLVYLAISIALIVGGIVLTLRR